MRDQAKRSAVYLAGQRRREVQHVLQLVVDGARDVANAERRHDRGRPHSRAVEQILAAARNGEKVTQKTLAERARCSTRTVRRAWADLKRAELINVKNPAPIRRGGQCVGRDPGGSQYFLGLWTGAARTLLEAAGKRSPKRPHKAASTKSVLRGGSHQRPFDSLDGKPAVRPVRQNE